MTISHHIFTVLGRALGFSSLSSNITDYFQDTRDISFNKDYYLYPKMGYFFSKYTSSSSADKNTSSTTGGKLDISLNNLVTTLDPNIKFKQPGKVCLDTVDIIDHKIDLFRNDIHSRLVNHAFSLFSQLTRKEFYDEELEGLILQPFWCIIRKFQKYIRNFTFQDNSEETTWKFIKNTLRFFHPEDEKLMIPSGDNEFHYVFADDSIIITINFNFISKYWYLFLIKTLNYVIPELENKLSGRTLKDRVISYLKYKENMISGDRLLTIEIKFE